MNSTRDENPNAEKERPLLGWSKLFDARMVQGVCFLRESLNVLQKGSKIRGKNEGQMKQRLRNDLRNASNAHDQFTLRIDIIYHSSVFVIPQH